jgi:nitrogen regulatory protein P-II 1
MVKIEAVIQPLKLDEAKAALEELEIRDITITEVLDHGSASVSYYYRGAEYRGGVARIKLEVLVSEDNVDQVIAAVMRAARTRESGNRDGRILVYEVADAVSIHSGAHMQHTLR